MYTCGVRQCTTKRHVEVSVIVQLAERPERALELLQPLLAGLWLDVVVNAPHAYPQNRLRIVWKAGSRKERTFPAR